MVSILHRIKKRIDDAREKKKGSDRKEERERKSRDDKCTE
jgi:hypothetical protein